MDRVLSVRCELGAVVPAAEIEIQDPSGFGESSSSVRADCPEITE